MERTCRKHFAKINARSGPPLTKTLDLMIRLVLTLVAAALVLPDVRSGPARLDSPEGFLKWNLHRWRLSTAVRAAPITPERVAAVDLFVPTSLF